MRFYIAGDGAEAYDLPTIVHRDGAAQVASERADVDHRRVRLTWCPLGNRCITDAADTRMSLAVGDRVGPYEIVGALGTGGWEASTSLAIYVWAGPLRSSS